MLTRAHRQEAVSRAYIHAIAGRCGLVCSFRDFDYGIDLSVHAVRQSGERYAESGHNLDIQAKTSTKATLTPADALYDMEVKAYDDLRDTAVAVPRILVLLVMPSEEPTWTEQSEEHLLLRKCAYWLSLKGAPPTSNTVSIRVTIPRANVFTVEALTRLMDKVRKREPL